MDSGTSRLAQPNLPSRDVIAANLQGDNERSGTARHSLSPKTNINFEATLARNGAKIMCANARAKANAVYVAQRTVGLADDAEPGGFAAQPDGKRDVGTHGRSRCPRRNAKAGGIIRLRRCST